MFGADIAFDRWILTDYFAGRFTDVISTIIATKLANAWNSAKERVAFAFAQPLAVRATAA